MANETISAEIVEVQEFPDVAQRYQVMGVPKTVINDAAEFVGAVPDEAFVDAILQSLGKPAVDWEPRNVAEGAEPNPDPSQEGWLPTRPPR